METTAAPAGVAAPTERASIGKQLAINIFWFANNFHWLAILNVLLPIVIATQLPARDKGLNFALIAAPGILVAFFVNPLTGALSDYARFKLGRRRPFMIIGTILNIVVAARFRIFGVYRRRVRAGDDATDHQPLGHVPAAAVLEQLRQLSLVGDHRGRDSTSATRLGLRLLWPDDAARHGGGRRRRGRARYRDGEYLVVQAAGGHRLCNSSPWSRPSS